MIKKIALWLAVISLSWIAAILGYWLVSIVYFLVKVLTA